MKRLAIAVAVFFISAVCTANTESAAAQSERIAPKHYADEKALDHQPATITVATAHALDAFPKGDAMATFSRGDSVVELAERHGWFLVEQLVNGVVTKSGWVARYVFEDKDAATKSSLHCTGTQVAVRQETNRCAYVCDADRDCRQDTCEAARLLSSGDVAYTTVCTPVPGAAPAPAPKVPSLFGTVRALDGKCPRLFTAAPKMGPLCYRSCKVDRDCPQDSSCKPSTDGPKLCFAH